MFPMGQNVLSDEEITKYINNGWHWHIKRRGKYRHIIRRKGQLTRGHGAYDDETWMRIQDLVQKWAEGLLEPIEDQAEEDEYDSEYVSRAHRRFMRLSADIERELRLIRGVHMFATCRHKDENYCTKWVWSQGFPLKKKLDEFYNFAIELKKESSRPFIDKTGREGIIFKASSTYCTGCPYHEPL